MQPHLVFNERPKVWTENLLVAECSSAPRNGRYLCRTTLGKSATTASRGGSAMRLMEPVQTWWFHLSWSTADSNVPKMLGEEKYIWIWSGLIHVGRSHGDKESSSGGSAPPVCYTNLRADLIAQTSLSTCSLLHPVLGVQSCWKQRGSGMQAAWQTRPLPISFLSRHSKL